MMPRESLPPPGWAKKLDRIFGDTGWRDAYSKHEHEQLDLFGEADETMRRDSGITKVLEYVTRRYRVVFPEVNGPAILRTERNTPLFALYSTVANPSEKARRISRKIANDLIRKLNG